MEKPSPSAAEKESRLLLSIAGGLGCLIVICVVLTLVAAALAFIWTIQGRLGPSSCLPGLTIMMLAVQGGIT